MFNSKCAFALLVPVAVLGLAAPVAAADQPPKAEIGVSYSVLHNDAGTYPLGWVFAVDGNITKSIAVVGEIGGNYKQMSDLDADVTIKEHTFLGGVKFSSRAATSAVPFVQVLTGVGNIAAGAGGESASVTAFAFQTGGGVDIRMGARASLRVQGDYRLLRKYGENLNEFRFAVGVVFGAGKR